MYILHADQCTFMIISRSIIHGMRSVSEQSCTENKNTISYSALFSRNRAVYEIMWENVVERDRPQVAIWSGTGHRWQYGAGQATGGNMERAFCMLDD